MIFLPAYYTRAAVSSRARVEARSPYLVEYALQRGRVVRPPIARRAEVARADELVHRVRLVLRVHPPEDLARRIEQAARLGWCRVRTLHEPPRTAGTRIHVALHPALDGRRPACQDSGPVQHAHGDGHVRETDVVEHQRASERSGVHGCAHEDGRI